MLMTGGIIGSLSFILGWLACTWYHAGSEPEQPIVQQDHDNEGEYRGG